MSDKQVVHKRKRSIQDTPIDVSKMRRLTSQLEALREELQGVNETGRNGESDKACELARNHSEGCQKYCIVRASIINSPLIIYQKVSFSNASNTELHSPDVAVGHLFLVEAR